MLLRALHGLVVQVHSVLVIEHDADTIAQSDWVIELGPGPGEDSGRIVFQGEPQGLVKAKTQWGDALRERIEPKFISS
jgi:excinuclease ABC subunit A